MKKLGVILSVVAVALLAVAGIARADSDFTTTTVDAQNSTTVKTAFGLGEVPWLWAQKTNPDPAGAYHYLITSWNIVNPDLSLTYEGFSTNMPPEGQDMWTTLSGFNWSTISAPVEHWEAISTLTDVNPQVDPKTFQLVCSDCSSTTRCEAFTRYVPEPISSALFLLGGSALGLRLFRRKKKA